jgi:hypothetical protein
VDGAQGDSPVTGDRHGCWCQQKTLT